MRAPRPIPHPDRAQPGSSAHARPGTPRTGWRTWNDWPPTPGSRGWSFCGTDPHVGPCRTPGWHEYHTENHQEPGPDPVRVTVYCDGATATWNGHQFTGDTTLVA